MDFYEKLPKSGGGYIFLSHSHDDIVDVRKIRNALEASGFEPLCFYLKCLTDAEEIEDLIKREIDAREWFIFVDSENSRKSKWVTMEREYITRTNEKKIIHMDLVDSASIENTLRSMVHGLRIFMVCPHKNRAVSCRIKDQLIRKDFLVYDWDDLYAAGQETTANAIAEASRDGCVLVVLSKEALESQYVRMELKYALHSGENVIPVILGDVELTLGMKMMLYDKQQYHLSADPTDQELQDMVENISLQILRSHGKI